MRPPIETFRDGHAARWLRDGAEAFAAMLGAIEQARVAVLLEMYWIGPGRVGAAFVTALCAAAQRGVQVAVLYDALGSMGLRTSMVTQLIRAGIHVGEFNPIAPWRAHFRLARVSRRNHRKLLIVDGHTAFLGGINLSDEWLARADGGQAWRDDAVVVAGPIVADLVLSFQRSWSLGRTGAPAPVVASPAPEPMGSVSVAALEQGPAVRRRLALRAYLFWVRRAEHRIWIVSAYFVPSRALVRALSVAARRGVDVRLMVPAEPDVPLVRYASRATWMPLLRAGVRIFEWMPTVLHAKTAVVDGRWVTTGSFNLDALSIRRNLELNVSLFDRHLAAQVEAMFERDLAQCREVDVELFDCRSLGTRLIESLAYSLRRWL